MYCRFHNAFQKHVPKFVTNVRIIRFNCSNFGPCLMKYVPQVQKENSQVQKESSQIQKPTVQKFESQVRKQT